MRFLADMGVAIRIVDWLRAQGHDAKHLRDVNEPDHRHFDEHWRWKIPRQPQLPVKSGDHYGTKRRWRKRDTAGDAQVTHREWEPSPAIRSYHRGRWQGEAGSSASHQAETSSSKGAYWTTAEGRNRLVVK
jgi:Domain of unknown function (DUF5615)